MNIVVGPALQLIGLFYVVSGVLVVRSLAAGATMDAAWTAITGTAPHPAERAREIWLAAGSVLVGVGGLALVLLLDLAAVLFVLCALQQLVYLGIVAPRYLDPHDEPDPAGRAQSWNAAIIYLVPTALVVTAAWNGVLRPWQDVPPWLLGAAAAAVAAGIVWTVRALAVRMPAGKAD